MKILFVIGASLWIWSAWSGVYNGAWLLGAALVAVASVRMVTRDQ
jgi:hypothetical protein